MNTPIAVIISDIHFSIKNLEEATAALSDAVQTSVDLKLPIIIAGDLIDTKSFIHGEVINRLIPILRYKKYRDNLPIYLLVGNHDLLNEKDIEHSLNFLEPYTTILIDYPLHTDKFYFIPYNHSQSYILSELSKIPKGSIIIMHQGFKGANMGDYIKDSSSLDPKLFEGYKVISGHYHRHQTIGPVTYIGSPYTITFGEAKDGPKGYLILKSDGSFDRKILKYRKHIIIESNINNLEKNIIDADVHKNDLIWIKLSGLSTELDKVNKEDLGIKFFKHNNYKLEKISIDSSEETKIEDDFKEDEILDTIIDSSNETDIQKEYLKDLYRSIICEY